MITEIEAIERRIAKAKLELERAEAELTRAMSDSTPPANIYGIKTMEDLREHLWRGCSLFNYRPGYIALFEPRGGGSYGGIYGPFADELGAIYDRHNFECFQRRSASSTA